MKLNFTKSLLFLFFTLCSYNLCFAQKQNNQWRFGTTAINFNNNPPISVPGSNIVASHGCASIADRTTGALLFYTDGMRVWTVQNGLMPNGTGLLGGVDGSGQSTSAAVIIPKPFSSGIYYIVTIDEQGSNKGINYSVVDMNLNQGFGDIIPGQKNIFLYSTFSEKLHVVRTSDSCGYWLLSHDNPGNTFIAFKVTYAGIQPTPILSSVGIPHNDGRGYFKINKQGNRLIMGNFKESSLELFDFDNSTGLFSNPIHWDFNESDSLIRGVEFSPDGTKVYASNLKLLFQYDISSGIPTTIETTKTILSQSSSLLNGPAGIQLAPDNKIYVTAFSNIDIINSPNNSGTSCNYQINAIQLLNSSQAGSSGYGLPQAVYELGYSNQNNKIQFSDTCLAGLTNFSISDTSNILSVTWNFGDPTSGINNTDNSFIPSHIFTGIGTFPVSVIINYRCAIDTLDIRITITNCLPLAPLGIKYLGDTCNPDSDFIFQVEGVSNSPYFAWNFGDPASGVNDTITITGSSTNPNPVHRFSGIGTYFVCVSYQELGFPIAQVCDTISIIFCCKTPTISITDTTVCRKDLPFLWNGKSYTTAGTYLDTLITLTFCDSIVRLNLTLSEPIEILENRTICDDQLPYLFYGKALTQSGNYTETLGGGCDTLVRLSLNVLYRTYSTETAFLCSKNLPYLWNGNAYTSPGTYTFTFVSNAKCDSIATLILLLEEPDIAYDIPLSLCKTDSGFFSINTDSVIVSTLWDFDDPLSLGNNISTLLSPSHLFTAAGDYDVKVLLEFACATVESTQKVTITDCETCTAFIPDAFSPNADGVNDFFQPTLRCSPEQYSFSIYNRWGQLFFETNDATTGWNGSTKNGTAPDGVYIFKLNYKFKGKLAQSEVGTVMVLR